MKHSLYTSAGFIGLLLLLGAGPLHAQKKGAAADTAKAKVAAPAGDIKSIAELTKKCRKMPGLFPLYQDTTNGTAYLEISENHLGKEYIYFSYAENGIPALGLNKGSYRENEVFSLRKYYNKIEWVKENTRFYFDPASALYKAKDANIAGAILASSPVVAQSADKKTFLVKADELFLTEALQQIKPSPIPGLPPGIQLFGLGQLSASKAKYVSLRNYPANTDLVVEYTYDNPMPSGRSSNDVTDPRYVTVQVQHTLVETPKNDFIPRADDPRVGFFSTQIDDQTTTSSASYRDLIHRWHLKKKDPKAALSEPVEPITWWMEKTTPQYLRPIIRKAGEAWNLAFEAAGFKNAVVIKEQSDTATWDAGDIRYNVLRWTSSPNPPFGGYGPSFYNPRTGQILGADIMLEWVFVSNRNRQNKAFDQAGMPLLEAAEAWERIQALGQDPAHAYCSAGMHLHHQAQLGRTLVSTEGLSAEEESKLLEESIYYLILHEMGHTMGLMHNMKASQLHLPATVHNRSVTEKVGLTGSVMDYPAINLASEKANQGQYFTTRPGPYDVWAITYGYSEGLDDPKAEQDRLTQILNRSTDPALTFGNDADDMRAPGKAIDPRVMIGDMSGDALTYSAERFKLMKKQLGKLKSRFAKPGASYQELRAAYLTVSGEIATIAGVVSRYVGGVYVDRGFIGQPGAAPKPYRPVPAEDQKRAMALLSSEFFAPSAYAAEAALYPYLQQQRRGFNFGAASEDPKITDRVLTAQRSVLDHLLAPTTLKRITDSELYGNGYKLSSMMNDLTAALFKQDAGGAVNTFRQNIQADYVGRLIAASGLEKVASAGPAGASPYGHVVQAQALAQLTSIKKMLALPAASADAATSAHKAFLLRRINKALDGKA